MKGSALALLLFLLFSSSGVSAGLRCGNKIVEIGDHESEVLRKCGDPTEQQQRYGYRGQVLRDPFDTFESNRYEEIVIDEWIYNFGPKRLQQYLRFENGYLREIRSLGYGYTPY